MSTGDDQFVDEDAWKQSSACGTSKKGGLKSEPKQTSVAGDIGCPQQGHTDVRNQPQARQRASDERSEVRASCDRSSKDPLHKDHQGGLDSLSSIHHPSSSLPLFAQGQGLGFSLPQVVTQPPISIDPSSLPPRPEDDLRGGFEADFVARLEDKHKCPICLLALREPVQTNCGHRFCRSCIKPVTKMKNPQCPLDKEPLEKAFPDNFCKREILALTVRCLNALAGCSWTSQLKELKLHLEGCSFTLVLCPHWDRGCHQRMLQAKLHEHVASECDYRDSFCTHCQSALPLKELEISFAHIPINS